MRTLSSNELQIGMKVLEAVQTANNQLVIAADTILDRQAIDRIRFYGIQTIKVEGEDLEASQEARAEESPKASQEPEAPRIPLGNVQNPTYSQKVKASSGFQSFQMNYSFANKRLQDAFKDIRTKKEYVNFDELLESTNNLIRSTKTNIELFDMLHNMRSVDDSVYAHSMNVALITRMIGRWMRMEMDELNTLTMAGLLHDIGKTMIPESVLNKTDKLTEEEFKYIQQHPQLGYNILKDTNLDIRIKDAALMHHERCDGSGYPSGLKEDDLDEFSMIVAIADVYDAMTAARAYRSPLCPFEVISNFEKDGYTLFKTKPLLTFLNRIASTYQNNRVILNDGRACNIVLLNQNYLSKPMVQFDDKSCLDLSTEKDLFIKALL